MDPKQREDLEKIAAELRSLSERVDEGAAADEAIAFSTDAYNPFIEKLKRYRSFAPVLRAATEEERSPLESGVELILESALRARQTIEREVQRVPLVRPDARSSVYFRLAAAKEYIDAHYAEEISVEQLAERACVSQYHFLRLFKSVFEVTPYRYLLLRRLSQAAELLRSTSMPVGDVAISVGFENLPVFSDSFRKEYGLPPSKYRTDPSPRKDPHDQAETN